MFYTSNGLILSVVRLTFLGPCFYSAVTNDVAGRSDLGILPYPAGGRESLISVLK
jgi:hypothetical protein